jgi:chromosome segregation ATPase
MKILKKEICELEKEKNNLISLLNENNLKLEIFNHTKINLNKDITEIEKLRNLIGKLFIDQDKGFQERVTDEAISEMEIKIKNFQVKKSENEDKINQLIESNLDIASRLTQITQEHENITQSNQFLESEIVNLKNNLRTSQNNYDLSKNESEGLKIQADQLRAEQVQLNSTYRQLYDNYQRLNQINVELNNRCEQSEIKNHNLSSNLYYAQIDLEYNKFLEEEKQECFTDSLLMTGLFAPMGLAGIAYPIVFVGSLAYVAAIGYKGANNSRTRDRATYIENNFNNYKQQYPLDSIKEIYDKCKKDARKKFI